jgi:DNA-binding IscR family transcriptional regulator
VWQKLRDGMTAIVDGITLQDMVEDYWRMNAQEDTKT